MKRFLFYLIVTSVLLHADTQDDITIHNKTYQDIFVRVYCVPTIPSSTVRSKDIYSVPSKNKVTIIRPDAQLKCSRYLAFSTNQDDLPSKLSKDDYKKLSSVGIGLGSAGRLFDNFYITKSRFGILKGYNTATWQPYRLLDEYEQEKIAVSPLIQQNPYSNQDAQVRIGTDICDQEKKYIAARQDKVQQALEVFLGKKLNGTYIPSIALVNSGGGERAFIASTGWHVGADKIGLLDTVMYDIGLSGGAWFVLSWMCSNRKMSEFKDLIQPLLAQPMPLDNKNNKSFVDALLVRDGLEQPITAVNAWGALLANRYLAFEGQNRQMMMFSQIARQAEGGAIPLPIVTAVNGYSHDLTEKRHQMDWFEWTPYEASGIGSWLGNAHIPTWGFGRMYNKNTSVNRAPEYDTGILMGICGSAFALTYARVYQEILSAMLPQTPFLASWATKIVNIIENKLLPSNIVELAMVKRASVAKAPNFAHGITGSTITGNLLRLIDGGIAFNLPIPPALARRADVIIVCDASAGALGGELQLAAKYAQTFGYPFPQIPAQGLDQKAMTVCYDTHNPAAPVVLYMPRIDPTGKVDTNFSTVKFQYTTQEFDQLSRVTENNMVASAATIKEVLTNLIESHGGFQ